MEEVYSLKKKSMCKLKMVPLCQMHDQVVEIKKCYREKLSIKMDPTLYFYTLANRIS